MEIEQWTDITLLRSIIQKVDHTVGPDNKDTQILIRHRSDSSTSEQYLIDVNPMVFALWGSPHMVNKYRIFN